MFLWNVPHDPEQSNLKLQPFGHLLLFSWAFESTLLRDFSYGTTEYEKWTFCSPKYGSWHVCTARATRQVLLSFFSTEGSTGVVNTHAESLISFLHRLQPKHRTLVKTGHKFLLFWKLHIGAPCSFCVGELFPFSGTVMPYGLGISDVNLKFSENSHPFLCWKNPNSENDFPSQLWRILIVANYIYDHLVFRFCAQHSTQKHTHTHKVYFLK